MRNRSTPHCEKDLTEDCTARRLREPLAKSLRDNGGVPSRKVGLLAGYQDCAALRPGYVYEATKERRQSLLFAATLQLSAKSLSPAPHFGNAQGLVL